MKCLNTDFNSPRVDAMWAVPDSVWCGELVQNICHTHSLLIEKSAALMKEVGMDNAPWCTRIEELDI